jgi:hypothetical protein
MEISIIAPVTPLLPPMPAGGCAYEPVEAPRVIQAAGGAQTTVSLDDGGAALGLDPHDDLSLAPQWLAWMEWVDACQPSLATPVIVAPSR